MSAPWRERLFTKATVDLETGCWIWSSGRIPFNGYPIFQGPAELAPEGKSTFAGAHRWAYIAINGPIPDGLAIDHLCNVRPCINPAHLEAVTHAENVRRAVVRRRERVAAGLPARPRIDWNDFIAAHKAKTEAAA